MAKRKQMTAKQLKAAWVKALRSGEYKQTRGTLCDENGYCCLGVLCKVAGLSIPHGAGQLDYEELKGVRDALGLGEYGSATTQTMLSNLNDHSRLSFKRIATWIEKNVRA